MADNSVVQEGDVVIWDVIGGTQILAEIRGKCKAKLGNSWISLRQLVNKPWGIALELAEDGSTLVPKDLQEEWDEVEDITRTQADQIYASSENQVLSAEDIERMKSQRRKGEEIVELLAQGSKNYDNKTEFAQKKWLKRKSKKYCPYAIVRRPTASTICEAMFVHSPVKIWEMRVDTLAAMLAYSNVGPYARVLVLDDCNGLVAGSAAERMGGMGTLWSVGLHTGKASAAEMIRAFNFPDEHIRSMRLSSMNVLLSILDDLESGHAAQGKQKPAKQDATPQPDTTKPDELSQPDDTTQPDETSQPDDITQVPETSQPETSEVPGTSGQGTPQETPANEKDIDAPATSNEKDTIGESLQQQTAKVPATDAMDGDDNDNQDDTMEEEALQEDATVRGTSKGKKHKKTPMGRRRVPMVGSTEALLQAIATGFDCLLVATPSVDPYHILSRLIPLLKPSSNFVIYSKWLQPLAEALLQLQDSKQALNLQLQEGWLREYQVLPLRTHPTMNMHGTGGYLLSGVSVGNNLPPKRATQNGGAGFAATKRQRR